MTLLLTMFYALSWYLSSGNLSNGAKMKNECTKYREERVWEEDPEMMRDWDETSCSVCVVSTQSHPIHMSIFNFLSSHICRAAAGQSDHK